LFGIRRNVATASFDRPPVPGWWSQRAEKARLQ
jgi:hypothetical protein